MAQPEHDDEPLAQDLPACPDCTASAGEDCREPDGSAGGTHPRRVERYHREHPQVVAEASPELTAEPAETKPKPRGGDRG